ncbi:MAG: hypothetical protein ACNA8W_17765, partial [Bradymonadaceae bacterium]
MIFKRFGAPILVALLGFIVACSNGSEGPLDEDTGEGVDVSVEDGGPSDLGDALDGDRRHGDTDADAILPATPLITGEAALDLVDPFMGTNGQGFGYAALTPTAQMPYGLVRLGPDTSLNSTYVPFHHFSGYHYGDPDVRGFSHLHFIGTGVPDYGNVRVLARRELAAVEPAR